jgi:hypothetical protein
MPPNELAGKLYRDLTPLIQNGDVEGVIRNVAKYHVEGMEPDDLFGILARIGSLRYSFERFGDEPPRSSPAVNACHNIARRLSREEGVLVLLQAAVRMAQEAKVTVDAPVTPYTDFPKDELEFLSEAMIKAILARNLERADGALERMLQQPRGREWVADMLLLAASLDRRGNGAKLIMATHALGAVNKLKWEVGFGMLRPVVHYLASGHYEKQRRFLERWVAETDLEERTVFASSRELSLREATALVDDILNGDFRTRVNHALRNNVSLKSMTDVLVVAACEWIVQGDHEALMDGLDRFNYCHAVRTALNWLGRDPLWSLLSGVEFVREGWEGGELTVISTEMELADPADFSSWAATQDGEATGLRLHIFANAFTREEQILPAELKPYLFRAVNLVRARAPESLEVQYAFNALAG